jgi:hypothetical protein
MASAATVIVSPSNMSNWSTLTSDPTVGISLSAGRARLQPQPGVCSSAFPRMEPIRLVGRHGRFQWPYPISSDSPHLFNLPVELSRRPGRVPAPMAAADLYVGGLCCRQSRRYDRESPADCGGGAGAWDNFSGAADGLTFAVGSTTTTFDFESDFAGSAPEPGTMPIIGSGLIGLLALLQPRYRR